MSISNRELFDAVQEAHKLIALNQECYVAQWIKQNPDEKIGDYELVYQNDWVTGLFRFTLRRKAAQ